jgi:hypothetical protein
VKATIQRLSCNYVCAVAVAGKNYAHEKELDQSSSSRPTKTTLIGRKRDVRQICGIDRGRLGKEHATYGAYVRSHSSIYASALFYMRPGIA